MATNSKAYNKANYKKYWGSPQAIADRSQRNSARRMIAKSKGDAAIKGKEVHHKNGLKAGNTKSNLSLVTRTYNRRDGAAKANGKKTNK